MFSKFMNRFYYGKSGKSDYTEADLPKNRRELFSVTLRTRFGSLIVLNLVYMLFYLPMLFVIINAFMSWVAYMYNFASAAKGMSDVGLATLSARLKDYQQALIMSTLIKLIPCILITGPISVGVAYDLRNWARDEHAFMWSDLWDSIKENWKQALGISAINSVMPLLIYIGFKFYGSLSKNNAVLLIPQVLLVMIGVMWLLASSFFYYLIVTYKLKFFDVIRNGALLSIARFPQGVVIKLINMIPIFICLAICYFGNVQIGVLIFILYYAVIGLCLAKFINASFANASFERFINPMIEGARTDIGLRTKEYNDLEEEIEKSEDSENAAYIDIDKEK